MKPPFQELRRHWPVFLLASLALWMTSGNAWSADQVRGVLRPVNEALLSTELTARVKKVGYREGERFKAGAVLLQFDCSRIQAESDAAAALSKARHQTWQTNKKMAKRNAVGKDELVVSRAEFEQASAQRRAAKARGKDCKIAAPYAGIVVEKMIQAHETSAPGQPLLKIVGTGKLEVELILPSHWMAWLKAGTAFEFVVDETRRSYPATLLRLGGAVDPASQTVKAYGRLNGKLGALLAGMSGTAQFEQPDG